MSIELNDSRIQRAIALIWHEAELLDTKDYQAWQELYTPEAKYVIPIDPQTEDFASSLNMVFDDDRMRRMRVARMVEGYSPSAVAAARTVRTVSRFNADRVSDTEVVIRSSQILCSYKRNRHDLLGANLTHHIALAADGDRIAQKVVRLLNSDDPVNASGFLL
ncbi:aromatic-ring-hydroxylating dioxygenase subunit beta [Granulicoccus phenolivorans]|uniref:aromatic-ring-hydroxylating dioxygenase subunit beta n=1 Tax=Granulicoccus phenolivorans TaxID=266854 RepID=UPI00040B59C6|nr:aromatic-ring-hydroxylating dioxygenase subunit beta [Granulicoccus phenolivorans]